MPQSNDNKKPGTTSDKISSANHKDEAANPQDKKTDSEFPGYPHYPSTEDIMDQRTDSHRVELDVENLPNSRNLSGVAQRFAGNQTDERNKNRQNSESAEDPEIGPRTDLNNDNLTTLDTNADEIGLPQNVDNEDLNSGSRSDADVTDDERKALEDTTHMPTRDENNLRRARLDNTDFDGEELNEDSFGERETGTGLDIPGVTDETFTDALGQGDEENKYYSLGGDRQEGNEEDPSGRSRNTE